MGLKKMNIVISKKTLRLLKPLFDELRNSPGDDDGFAGSILLDVDRSGVCVAMFIPVADARRVRKITWALGEAAEEIK